MGVPANWSSVHLPAIHPSANCLLICPSILSSISCLFSLSSILSIYLLSIHLPSFLSIYLSIYPSSCLPIRPFICPSSCLSIHPSTCLLSIHLSFLPPICQIAGWGVGEELLMYRERGSVSTAGRAHAICSAGFMPSRLAPHDLCETLVVHVGRHVGRCSPGSGTRFLVHSAALLWGHTHPTPGGRSMAPSVVS